jgi:hypothetical protein
MCMWHVCGAIATYRSTSLYRGIELVPVINRLGGQMMIIIDDLSCMPMRYVSGGSEAV